MKIALGVLSAMLACPALAASIPKLSGSYVYTWSESCYDTSNGSMLIGTGVTSGAISFDLATGMATLNAEHASGNQLSLQKMTGSGPYSNTATKLSIGSHTFDITYGKVESGIADYASYIGVVPGNPGDTCLDLVVLSLK